MSTYIQCRLQRGCTLTTAWIPERGAKVGAEVELLPEKYRWQVVEAFPETAMPAEDLKEAQKQRRAGLPSIGKVDR